MPVKYECPKCGRRFVEWGAEKLGYLCPHDDKCSGVKDDEVIKLTRVGAEVEENSAPSLKRKPAKKAAPPPPKEEEVPDTPTIDDAELEDDEDTGDDSTDDSDDLVTDDADSDGEDDGDDDSDDDDAPEDLDFENKKPSLDDSPIKEFDE